MKRLLHLQHHHHTGKRITHRHTSYRGLLVVVALFGVALGIIHQTVRASEIIASAKVAAAVPSQPAVITSHHNEEVVSTSSITLAGTCSYVAPSTAIELYIDGQFVGSGVCQSNGSFTISTSLAPGRHQLRIRTVNTTNDYGPDSAIMNLIYTQSSSPSTPQIPAPPLPTATNPTTPPTYVAPNGLQIYSKYTYLLYGPEKDAEWAGYFGGGTAPYRVTIDWGDGTASNYTATDSNPQIYRHSYSKYEPFFVTLTLTDAENRQATMQVAAITPYVATSSTSGFMTGGELARIDQILLYSGYATLATLILLGVLTIYHAEYIYVHPYPVAKQPVRVHRRKRR